MFTAGWPDLLISSVITYVVDIFYRPASVRSKQLPISIGGPVFSAFPSLRHLRLCFPLWPVLGGLLEGSAKRRRHALGFLF